MPWPSHRLRERRRAPQRRARRKQPRLLYAPGNVRPGRAARTALPGMSRPTQRLRDYRPRIRSMNPSTSAVPSSSTSLAERMSEAAFSTSWAISFSTRLPRRGTGNSSVTWQVGLRHSNSVRYGRPSSSTRCLLRTQHLRGPEAHSFGRSLIDRIAADHPRYRPWANHLHQEGYLVGDGIVRGRSSVDKRSRS